MKITRIDAFGVDVPWVERIGERMTLAGQPTRTYVYRVQTDEGIVGIGEGGDIRIAIPRFLGRDPFDFVLDDSCGPLQPALYDIMGKALGKPVWKLLGQGQRDTVPVAYWSHCLPPRDLAREVEVAVENGFLVHKVKARPWFDIVEQVKTASEGVPENFMFIVDANGTFWLPSKTVRIAKKLEGYQLLCLESPIPQENVNGYVEIRGKVGIPIAIHMGVPNPITAIERGVCDYFVIEEEGAAATLRYASIAEVAGGSARASGGFVVSGMPVWLEIVGLGIVEAFGLHLGAVARNATLPSIMLVHSQFLREDDLIVEPLRVKDGYADVPKGPGLGVELDEKALEKYRVE